MIIAIDGPAGAGKGTLAKRLASHLEYAFLDTGLLYRAVGSRMFEKGLDLTDPKLAEATARALSPTDLTNEEPLRTESAGAAASQIAAIPEVRAALLQFQRAFAITPPAPHKGAVLDGRDIGTVVCPDADLKFFITASLEKRAGRRLKELQMRGINSIYEEVFEEVKARDARDSQRKSSPLKPSDDAIVIDTSEMTIDDVFQQALSHIEDQHASQA